MKNNSLQRIALLIFIIVIFFSLFFIFGLLFTSSLDSNFAKSVSPYLLTHIVVFILGIVFYKKLWQTSKTEFNRRALFFRWVLMFVFFTSVPLLFYFLTKTNNDKNKEARLLYETEHCQEITTKQHKYILKKCDNGYLIGDLTSVEEYRREIK